MTRKLGVPGCPTCKGEGLIPGTTVIRETADGRRIEYPTSRRCSCLSVPAEASPEDLGESKSKPDAQSRAAGEKE